MKDLKEGVLDAEDIVSEPRPEMLPFGLGVRVLNEGKGIIQAIKHRINKGSTQTRRKELSDKINQAMDDRQIDLLGKTYREINKSTGYSLKTKNNSATKLAKDQRYNQLNKRLVDVKYGDYMTTKFTQGYLGGNKLKEDIDAETIEEGGAPMSALTARVLRNVLHQTKKWKDGARNNDSLFNASNIQATSPNPGHTHPLDNSERHDMIDNGPNTIRESRQFRHQKTLTSDCGTKSCKIYRDTHWDEYRVKHYQDGKHLDADYHTDDYGDAEETAKRWTHPKKSMNEGKDDFGYRTVSSEPPRKTLIMKAGPVSKKDIQSNGKALAKDYEELSRMLSPKSIIKRLLSGYTSKRGNK